ncbi:MAG TPA: hypothetical protein VER98_01275 [Terriglobia bacterium]|nr:hypothetical protein [Terriglobia bacterium]
MPEDTGCMVTNPSFYQGAYLFPQGGGRARAYIAYPAHSVQRLQGEEDIPRFIEESVRAGAPGEFYQRVKPCGPLASFEAADTWVEHPYRNGIALIGDAAASNDPSWAQGLSLTLRDVRILRDELLSSDDWNTAGHNYARKHDFHYGVIHQVTLSMRGLFLETGPDADACRAKALPLIGQDMTRIPDHVFGGPDLPWDSAVRRRFFGEEHFTTSG